MSFEIYHGDSLDIMGMFLPDSSVDAIVCDPPYGLSDGSTEGVADRFSRIFLDVVLPDLHDANVALGRLQEFGRPLACVTFLDRVNRAIGEETGVAVPESSVDFQSYVARNQEIERAGVGSVCSTDCELLDVIDSQLVKDSGDFILQLRANRDAPFRDGLRRAFRQLDAGRFCVPIVIPFESKFARFLGTLLPSDSGFLRDVVRLCDDTQRNTESSSEIVALARTEVNAMLTFDLRNGTLELSPARPADEFDFVFLLSSAEPVRANAGTSGLSAKFEPSFFRFVGDVANRAITIHFHKEILRTLHYSRKGFMGKEWDSFVPTVELWKECLRVLKPGGYLLSFAGTRTQHRMAVNIEDAGFEIRDMIAWVYGSGFPKHRSSLKPALEPITMARKPAKVATLLNIDACRVGDESTQRTNTAVNSYHSGTIGESQETGAAYQTGSTKGRYPANLIHDGSDEVVALFPDSAGSGGSVPNVKISGYGDGAVGTGSAEYLGGERTEVDCGTGSAARFFYCAKASKRDRNEGLEDRVPTYVGRHAGSSGQESCQINPHPTVKPTELMRYLCRLVTPPGGVILDPFMGSGSTGKAAMREGFNFIGIEREAEYVAIAEARIKAAI